MGSFNHCAMSGSSSAMLHETTRQPPCSLWRASNLAGFQRRESCGMAGDLRVREYAQPMAELIHNSHLSIKCKPSMEKSKPDNTRPQQDSMAESRRNAAVKAWV